MTFISNNTIWSSSSVDFIAFVGCQQQSNKTVSGLAILHIDALNMHSFVLQITGY